MPCRPAARPTTQRGWALLAVVTTIAFVAAGALSAWVAARSREADAALEGEQLRWLEGARVQLEQWYLRELAVVDARPEAPEAAAVLEAAGLTLRWGARLQVGERIAVGERAGREFVLSIPRPAAPASARPLEARVAGADLQGAAIARARFALEGLARDFELGYRARHLADPSRDTAVNHFRARDCLRRTPTELPCLDEWTALAAVVLPEGVDAQWLVDPWGGEVQARNDPDPAAGPLHALRLRVVTPWGAALEVHARPAL